MALETQFSVEDWRRKRNAKWQALRDEVDDRGGLATVEMRRLRDLDASGRIGRHVLTSIDSELKRVGLGHQPPVLPSNQWELVRLFTVDSRAQTLIEAAGQPGETGDATLRQALEGGRREIELLQEIRELLGS